MTENQKIAHAEVAKDEFLQKLADLDVTANYVSKMLENMQYAINETIRYRTQEIKLSDVLNRKNRKIVPAG